MDNHHGVVVPREDGVRARCFGPGLCIECNKELQAATHHQRQAYYQRVALSGEKSINDIRNLKALVEACDPGATPELRALRAWHWRIAMNARAAAKSYRDNGSVYALRQAKASDRRADFHIKAVQALNDVVSGTAEQDCKTLLRESMHHE